MSLRGEKIEVVGADSRQIYRHLTVGTAKPTDTERRSVPHHMIDVADLQETYNAARYGWEASEASGKIHRRGALPLVVGGSGLYIQSLMEGIFEGPGADEVLRRKLEAFAKSRGNSALHDRLAECDPETAEIIHPNDRKRLIRALEVFEITGQPISVLRARAHNTKRFLRPCYFGISWSPDRLSSRIEERVRKMLEGGMGEEAVMLADLGLTTSRSFEGLGYAEALAFHRCEADFDSTLEAISRLHRNYAKRQRTWFRKLHDVCWFNPAEYQWADLVEQVGKSLLSYRREYPFDSGACVLEGKGER